MFSVYDIFDGFYVMFRYINMFSVYDIICMYCSACSYTFIVQVVNMHKLTKKNE